MARSEHTHVVAEALIAECRRRLFDESVPRLKTCLSLLSEDEVWFRPNEETVSVGNLVLHLCGNVRQWIVSALGGVTDTRKRAQEFAEPGPIATSVLLEKLDQTMADVSRVLKEIDPATLLETRKVQGFDESGVSILVHVVEHFSYHVGQISYIVKSRKALDLKYYDGIELNNPVS